MAILTRVFIVHMLPARACRFFARASAAGMMNEGYVWIVTDNVGFSLDVLPQHNIQTMQGVVGFWPYVAKSARNIDFMGRFGARFRAKYHQLPDIRMARPTVYQYWAYDVAWAVATLSEKVKGIRFSNRSFQTPEGVRKSLIDTLLPSPVGPELLSAILETDFDGLAGRFALADRHMQVPVYEVVNVIGDQAKGIGFWSPASGSSRLLNPSTSHGQTKFRIDAGEIHWPGDSKAVPKGWDLPVNGKILKIGVLVDTIPGTNTVSVSGYSIDVFEAAVKKVPYALRYNYIPFDCANSYDKLVTKVYLKEFDAAVGDVAIITNRARDVDFTMPYTESGVSMLVLSKNSDKLSMWIFFQPLTNDLWIATAPNRLFIFVTGLVVWMSEYPTNDEFQGSRLRQFSTVFYFIFSTLTFSHDQIIKRLPSKVLVVIWCFVVLTLVQSYTASLSSLLTAKRLQPSVTDPGQLLRNGDYVGYQNGSFVLAKLTQLKFDEGKIKVFSTPEEYAKALRAGSNLGGVSAIFDEIPYLNTFLVFPRGSPVVPDLSRAILDLREGHEGFAIQQKWFGDATPSLDYGGRGTDSA
uniref:Ionotropic glutamate receptor C-terminal domain-containing protein n=1 Tax=Setaria italica TaxID=4555 RepID=K3Y1Y8_SETIT